MRTTLMDRYTRIFSMYAFVNSRFALLHPSSSIQAPLMVSSISINLGAYTCSVTKWNRSEHWTGSYVVPKIYSAYGKYRPAQRWAASAARRKWNHTRATSAPVLACTQISHNNTKHRVPAIQQKAQNFASSLPQLRRIIITAIFPQFAVCDAEV